MILKTDSIEFAMRLHKKIYFSMSMLAFLMCTQNTFLNYCDDPAYF